MFGVDRSYRKTRGRGTPGDMGSGCIMLKGSTMFVPLILIVLIFGMLSGCTTSLSGRPLPDDPYGWNGAGRFIPLASPGTSTELRRGFAQARQGEVYFGALHWDHDSERYAYARNWNSVEAAIAVSAAVCQGDAGKPCILAALVLPAALPAETRQARGFSVQTLNQFRLLYADVQEPGLWGAYAISPMAAQGFSAREMTEQDARLAALRHCQFRLDAELAEIGASGAAAAREAGFDTCEVVHITPP
jgi:hypothetical protein